MSYNSRKLELHQSSKINQIQTQNFDYFFVLDFEAVWNPEEKVPEEIIEFPTVVIDAKTLQVVSEFHQYVRPILSKTLNSYCTEMTKITQEMVDAADPFPQVFSRYDKWVKNFLKSSYGFDEERKIPNYYQRIAYVTCGNWDLNKMVKIQCKRDRIEVPEYFDSFINIKEAFYQHYHTKRQKHQLGMASILRELKIPLQGHHHSGIDDCRNIARIVIRMVEDSFIFNYTFPYNTYNNNNQNNRNDQRNDLHQIKYPANHTNDNQNRNGETVAIQSNNNTNVNKKKNRVQNAYIPSINRYDNNNNDSGNKNSNNDTINNNNNKYIGEKRANHSIPIKQGRTNDGMISVRSCGILVLKRSSSKPNYPSEFLLMKHKNRYDLPKGHQHEGETDIDTAYRELWEETGITQSQITLIPNFKFSSVYYPQYARFQGQSVQKTVVYFAAYLCDSNDCDISLEEHIGFEWMAWNPYRFVSKNVTPILSSLHQFLMK